MAAAVVVVLLPQQGQTDVQGQMMVVAVVAVLLLQQSQTDARGQLMVVVLLGQAGVQGQGGRWGGPAEVGVGVQGLRSQGRLQTHSCPACPYPETRDQLCCCHWVVEEEGQGAVVEELEGVELRGHKSQTLLCCCCCWAVQEEGQGTVAKGLGGVVRGHRSQGRLQTRSSPAGLSRRGEHQVERLASCFAPACGDHCSQPCLDLCHSVRLRLCRLGWLSLLASTGFHAWRE